MFWIVHLFALLIFPVALFLTVPLHIIASRMPKPQAGPPSLPGVHGQRPAGHVPGPIVAMILVMTGLFVVGMYVLLLQPA